MSDFRIRDFLDRLNALGLMLSATRLADGSIRLNQWRGINFYENEAEIKNVWMSNMAGQDGRMQDVAREQGVPAYVILHDRTLHELVARQPRTTDDLLDIPGIGQAKVERYGETLLATLTSSLVENHETS